MSYLSKIASEKLHAFHKATADHYGAAVGQQYTASPSISQTLHDKIIEDGDPFLSRINLVPVSEIKGQKVFLGLNNRLASRTAITATTERVPRNLASTDQELYELFQTNYDSSLPYSLVDAWAKFQDFATRYNNRITTAIGNDKLTIGWHGTSHAATTDIAANPNLEDVNVGWLEQIRAFNSASQFSLGTTGTPIELGSAAFPNLDTLVHDAIGRIETPFVENPNLVALVSRNLIMAAEGDLYATSAKTPTEKLVMDLNAGQIKRTYGGLATYLPPFFPDSTILVTSFENLSIYWQETSMRRIQKDAPERNEAQDFISLNEGFVVEQLKATSLIQGITII